MNYWLVATYKINEIKKVKRNLSNQGLRYYLPKITIEKINSKPKEEILFPGYIFVNARYDEHFKIKYTRGIKNIIKFGKKISYITDDEMLSINKIEESSKLKPFSSSIAIGQEVLINSGYLKGNLVTICSLPSKKRVDVLLHFLGSVRKLNISENVLAF